MILLMVLYRRSTNPTPILVASAEGFVQPLQKDFGSFSSGSFAKTKSVVFYELR